MSKQLLDKPDSMEAGADGAKSIRAATTTPIASAPTATTTPRATPIVTATRVAPRPSGQEMSAWWREDSSKRLKVTAAGSVAGLLILVALVVALIANAGGGVQTASNMSGMSGMSGASNTSPITTSPNAPAHQLYNPALPPVAQGDTVNVTLTAKESLISISKGIAYHAWTFNGTVPGPALHVRQGQRIHFTLINGSNMPHSIDFHAAQTPWDVNYKPIGPGQSFSFDWTANYPGVFMYHCGTPPVMEHIANGMYGAIIVDPANGWAPAQEYVLVQSEFYLQKQADGSYVYNAAKAMAGTPDFVVFNGYDGQYRDQPIQVKAGQRVRLYIVNAGPSDYSGFHVIGAIFSDSYADGNPANHTVGNQTVTIPPGGGEVVELTMPEAGKYPFLTHAFSAAMKGAIGVLQASK
jgi:nitrite reductase (NO-forming)